MSLPFRMGKTKKHLAWQAGAAVIYYDCGQIGLPVGLLRRRTNAKGGNHMTDYEMIMVFLTFLTLLVMVSKKNNG